MCENCKNEGFLNRNTAEAAGAESGARSTPSSASAAQVRGEMPDSDISPTGVIRKRLESVLYEIAEGEGRVREAHQLLIRMDSYLQGKRAYATALSAAIKRLES
jgi:hypothetical protein